MKDPDLDRLFERFRREGDVEAMGAIFDATVAELSRVGSAWARSADEVEDLVQATYLTAIERSERYEGGRKLVAWLLGILVMHAHELRARRGRQLDPERLHERTAEPADARALGGELAEAFGAALGRLRAAERRVVEPFLVEGKSPKAIAQEQGERAGTVRMQLHRGLARLREILPAGFALGTAVVLIGDRARAQVRERVLHHASEIAAASAAAGGTVVGSTGGLSVQTLTLTSLALAVLTLGGWFALSPDPAVQPAPAVTAPEGNPLEAPTPVAGTSLTEPAATAQDARRSVSDPAPAARAGARVSGRLHYPDGSAAAGLELVLFGLPSFAGQLTLGEYVSPDGSLLAPSMTTARSDADGRFTLDGWNPHERQLLAVDPGGAWGSLVQVHASPAPQGVADLGDIPLLTMGAVAGTVVDGEGNPVAGARVRVATYPDVSISNAHFGELTADARLFASTHNSVLTVPIPVWARPFVERAPVPTVRTDAQGRYELPCTMPNERGEIALVVDAPGFVPATQTLSPSPGLGVRELGPIGMGRGRRIEGVLRDSQGQPVEGWEVFVGAFADGDSSGLGRPAGRTDEHGAFALDNVSVHGVPTATAVPPGERIGAVGQANADGLIELVTPSLTALRVRVLDESRSPVPEAELRLRMPAFDQIDAIVMHAGMTLPWSSPEPGLFTTEGLSVERFPLALVVRAPGYADSRTPFLPGTSDEVEVLLRRASRTEVRLLDGRDGEPLAGASVSLTGTDSSLALARGVSDAEGRCVLLGVPAGAADLSLRVSHPELAQTRFAFRPASEPATFTLAPPGRLEVSTHGAPESPYTLVLTRPSLGRRLEERLEWSGVSSADGHLTLELLAEGDYTWSATQGSQQGLPLSVETPPPFAQGALRITGGQATRLELGSPAAEGALSSGLQGRVLMNGEPLGGALLRFVQEGSAGATVQADAAGRYEFEGLRAGPVEVGIGVVREASGSSSYHHLGFHEAEVPAAGMGLAEWDLVSYPVEVLVEDRSGPVAGADVFLSGPLEARHQGLESGRTTRAGLVRLDTLEPGTYRLRAVHPELGLGLGQVVLDSAGQLAPAHVLLERGVPCAGTVTVTAGLIPESRYDLVVDDLDTGQLLRTEVRFVDGQAHFAFKGLPAGRYGFSLASERAESPRPSEVVLPPGGDEGLRLTLGLPTASAGKEFQAVEIR